MNHSKRIIHSGRFSRKSLNLIIIVVALLIVILVQLGDREALKTTLNQLQPSAKTTAQANPINPITPAKHSSNPLLELLESTASLDPKPLNIAIEHWHHTPKESLTKTPVYFIAAPNIPMVDIRILFNAGSAQDGTTTGLAKLTTALLDEGTQQLDVNQIAESFESIGAQFSTSSHRDMAVVSLRTLTLNDYHTQAIALLKQLLSDSIFPQSSIDRIKAQMQRSLEHQQQSPSALIAKHMWQNLYPDHPYGSPPEGTRESISALTQEEVKKFFNSYFSAQNATLAIVGAITTDQAKTIASALLNTLPQGQPIPPLAAPQPLQSTQHIHIPYPSDQTHIRIAQLGLERSAQDHVAFYIGNEILGGSGFSAILNQAIRQDRGLAYSVFSAFVAMQKTGPFWVDIKTQNDQAETALSVALKELNHYVQTGPTLTQLTTVKTQINNGHPLLLASNASQLAYLGNIGFYQLPIETLTHFTEAVSQATVSSVHQAWKDRFARHSNNNAQKSSPWLIVTLGPEKPALLP